MASGKLLPPSDIILSMKKHSRVVKGNERITTLLQHDCQENMIIKKKNSCRYFFTFIFFLLSLSVTTLVVWERNRKLLSLFEFLLEQILLVEEQNDGSVLKPLKDDMI